MMSVLEYANDVDKSIEEVFESEKGIDNPTRQKRNETEI